jgi:hypothetical protein
MPARAGLRRAAAAAFLIAAAASPAALAEPTAPVPPVPAGIEVPAGHTLFLTGRAQGTQNYICLPAGAGFAWRLFSPQATLFFTMPWAGSELRHQFMTHYLSPNPEEDGTPRPTWQSSRDTSAVWARAVASSADPAFVEAGAIPWLRLEVVGTAEGPGGGDALRPTTFIQRLNTSGGPAPAEGCSQASHVGATVMVPYRADYFFYKARKK